jgi:hypothetical protein
MYRAKGKMAEEVIDILFLLGLSAVFWLLVFSKSARYKLQKGAWLDNRQVNQEQSETNDAIALAGALVLALFFTILSFVAVIGAIVGHL